MANERDDYPNDGDSVQDDGDAADRNDQVGLRSQRQSVRTSRRYIVGQERAHGVYARLWKESTLLERLIWGFRGPPQPPFNTSVGVIGRATQAATEPEEGEVRGRGTEMVAPETKSRTAPRKDAHGPPEPSVGAPEKIERQANASPPTRSRADKRSSRKPRDKAPIPIDEESRLPVLGRAAAGLPHPVEVHEQYGETLQGHLGLAADDYIVEIRGSSMEDAGLHDGDLIVIRPESSIENGDIALVHVNDPSGEEALTIKRFFREGERIRLEPIYRDDARDEPLRALYYDLADIQILGKPVATIHPGRTPRHGRPFDAPPSQ